MIAFIVMNPDAGYNKRIAGEVEKRGIKTMLLSWRDFDYGMVKKLTPGVDKVFFRTGARQSVLIARAFEEAGFTVINNAQYIQLSRNKYLANVYAQANGIAVPRLNVRLEKNNLDLISLYLKQNGSLVAKPVISRDQGRFVFRLDSESDYADLATIPGKFILLQNEVRFERLVRTIVTSDGILTEGTSYDTKHDSWKATVCENPLAKHYSPVPADLINIAEKTVNCFGGHVAYIDFFETSDGFILNEINHSCGLMHHERITGFPIAEHLAKFLVEA